MFNINTKELLGDPGYDGENIHRMMHETGTKQTILPPNHLCSKKTKTERQQNAAHRQIKGHQKSHLGEEAIIMQI